MIYVSHFQYNLRNRPTYTWNIRNRLLNHAITTAALKKKKKKNGFSSWIRMTHLPASMIYEEERHMHLRWIYCVTVNVCVALPRGYNGSADFRIGDVQWIIDAPEGVGKMFRTHRTDYAARLLACERQMARSAKIPQPCQEKSASEKKSKKIGGTPIAKSVKPTSLTDDRRRLWRCLASTNFSKPQRSISFLVNFLRHRNQSIINDNDLYRKSMKRKVIDRQKKQPELIDQKYCTSTGFSIGKN